MEQHEEMAWMLRSFIEGESRSDGAQSTESKVPAQVRGRFKGEVQGRRQSEASAFYFSDDGKADLTTRRMAV